MKLRTLDNIDVTTLKVTQYNGREEPDFDPEKDEVHQGNGADTKGMKLDSTAE